MCVCACTRLTHDVKYSVCVGRCACWVVFADQRTLSSNFLRTTYLISRKSDMHQRLCLYVYVFAILLWLVALVTMRAFGYPITMFILMSMDNDSFNRDLHWPLIVSPGPFLGWWLSCSIVLIYFSCSYFSPVTFPTILMRSAYKALWLLPLTEELRCTAPLQTREQLYR